MADILNAITPDARARIVAALGVRPRGLFSDVDGTLSPIAPTPEAAVLLLGIRELLEQARRSFDVVAAVSGRTAEDARRMVGVDAITYIGNHGFERIEPDGTYIVLPAAEPYQHPIAELLARLGRELLPRFPGLRMEPKGATASIHVRGTQDPGLAEEVVYSKAAATAGIFGLRVTRGKLVIELRPPIAVDKGTAVADVIRDKGLQSAFYLGDDRTDIDAFRALRRLTAAGTCRGVSVAVLHLDAPPDLADEADVALPSIEAVPAFISLLLQQE
jgi:trehalose 6-phosphate phosphatase